MKKSLLLVLLICFISYCKAQDSTDYFKNGNKKYEEGNFIGAIEDFTKSISMNNQKGMSYEMRVRCKQHLNGLIGNKVKLDGNDINSDMDSARFYKSEKEREISIIYNKRRDSLITIAKKYKIPDSYIIDSLNPSNKWLNDWINQKEKTNNSGNNNNAYYAIQGITNLLSQSIKPNVNSPFMCSFVFNFDKDGIITDVICKDKSCEKKMVDKIITITKTKKIVAFKGSDGNNYNSFANLKINIWANVQVYEDK